MSTILKALKKLEEERRAAEPPGLSARLVAGSADAGRRQRSGRLIAVGAAGGGVVAAVLVAGFFWLQGASPMNAPHRPATALPEGASPLIPAGVDVQRREAVPAPSVPEHAQQPASRQEADVPQPAKKSPAAPVPNGEAVRITGRPLPAVGENQPMPSLQVTEIFSATADGERMAMVNGLPVMVGTRVEDALVREIAGDRVVFEIGGRTLAVPLRAAARMPLQNVQPSGPSSSQR